MKNESKENFGPNVPLTLQALEDLKKQGYRYVRVNAFTHDKRMDYMEPHYMVLVPLRELPNNMEQKGIYEPIDSPLLATWASSPDEGIKVFILKG